MEFFVFAENIKLISKNRETFSSSFELAKKLSKLQRKIRRI